MKQTRKHVSALAASLLAASMLLSACQTTPAVSPAPSAVPSPTAPVAAGVSYADTVAWDGQYDVVVIGFGGAGAVAAKNAAATGARVLIVEKAPEGHEGGNTRYSGQMFAYGNGNYEDTLSYYTALAGSHHVPQAMLELYSQKVANMTDVVAEEFGLDKNDFMDVSYSPYTAAYNPEYPELPGAESINLMSAHEGFSDGYLWGIMRQAIVDNADSIDVWFESPATRLVQDPGTKTVLGVEVERGGALRNIRATNGVVMACGGFENNKEMVETFLGLSTSVPQGTLYNTGDGVRMAMEVGADLWHMDVYEGMGASIGSTTVIEERVNHSPAYMPPCNTGSVILVSGAGNRFLNESEFTRHGHIKNGDVYANPWYPDEMYLVLGQENYQTAVAYGAFEADYEYTYTGNTMDELATAAGIDPAALAQTIQTFNGYAAAGADAQFGRNAASMSAFAANGPYYAVKMAPIILNTQGGARRNENAEVLDTTGNPIPHLYSAGEFGGICSLQYQGGSNIAECIITGQIAGRNAAAVKTDYTSTILTATAASLVYTPGVESDLTVADYSDVVLGENEYLGIGSGGMGGDIALKVKVVGGVIEAINVVAEKETPERFESVKSTLIPAIIKTNSTDVDTISSCTLSSNAVIAAVEDALSQAK